MKQRRVVKTATVMALTAAFVAWHAGEGGAAEQSRTAPAKGPISSAQAKSSPVIGDGGSDGMYDPGVDLVVSKVVMTRGVFGGDPSHRIKIVPYVKNMWRGRTSKRIKILLDGLALAEWIETGIRANEEKAGGALYLPDTTPGGRALRFSVEVDNDNNVPENNDLNNRCGPISLLAQERSRTHACPIVGPHEKLI